MMEANRSTGPNASEPESAARGLAIVRIIDAPRALVFKGWTDPERVAQSLERLEAYVAA